MRIKRTTTVILLEDIYKTGVAGEIVKVAPGYARNYLIPNGMALPASKGTMNRMQSLLEGATVRRAEREKEYSEIASRIEGLELFYPVRAGETGKLYGSVTPSMVADTINEELGLSIDRRRIGDRPLRELGAFNVPVRLEAGMTTTVKVVVYREGEDPRLVVEEEETEDPEEAEVAAEEVKAEAEEIVETEEVEETSEDEETVAE